jgi:enoyl-CoA hydratase/carnithine racemase
MNYETLKYEVVEPRIAIVTFDTPARLNAISQKRLDEIEAVLDVVEKDAALGALVLTGGEGKAYCVGLDLDLLDRAFVDVPYFEQVVRRINGIVLRLEALPIPTIAAINGYARAGGFEISMGCDFILMADEALIGDVHTDAGVIPAVTSMRLARRIGTQRAKEIIWTGRWMTGAEAVECGLALRSVPRAQLRAETIAFAASMTTKPGPCIAANKSVFQQSVDQPITQGVENEIAVFVRFMTDEPYGKEGYAAYREGREPFWKQSN